MWPTTERSSNPGRLEMARLPVKRIPAEMPLAITIFGATKLDMSRFRSCAPSSKKSNSELGLMTDLPVPEDVLKSANRIRGCVEQTSIFTCKSLNDLSGAELFFKCENLQKTGSFKFRGASNALQILAEQGLPRAVATHSSGNHGAALAKAAADRGVEAQIVMPNNAPKVKQEAVQAYDGIITHCEPTLDARESTLKEILKKLKAEEIPPYNDSRIISGQGTAALELCNEIPDLDFVVTPVGGGGLLSGTALALQTEWPQIRLVGAEPLNADDAKRSLDAGRLIPATRTDTIADGLRTSLGSLTFPLIQKYVETILTVSEEPIISATRLIWQRMKMVVEPSGAVPLAVVLNHSDIFEGKRIGVIASGGNYDPGIR